MFDDIHHVRNVAGRKQMYCLSFKLTDSLLFSERTTSYCGGQVGAEGENETFLNGVPAKRRKAE